MATCEAGRATVWVCTVCGKKSRDLAGQDAIDPGYDEKCVMNATRAYEDCLLYDRGHFVGVLAGGLVGKGGERR